MDTLLNNPAWMQVAEIEISYKTKVKPSERPVVESSADIYKLLLKIWDKDLIELQEELKILLLNRRNKVLGIINLSSGGISGTVVDPRLVLAAVIKSAAVSFVMAHNHPSGDCFPSKADVQLTKNLKEAAKFIDVTLLDHLVITSENYYSFADEGVI